MLYIIVRLISFIEYQTHLSVPLFLNTEVQSLALMPFMVHFWNIIVQTRYEINFKVHFYWFSYLFKHMHSNTEFSDLFTNFENMERWHLDMQSLYKCSEAEQHGYSDSLVWMRKDVDKFRYLLEQLLILLCSKNIGSITVPDSFF